MSVSSVISDFIPIAATVTDIFSFASTSISVYYLYDEFGNTIIDENGRFFLVDEHGMYIGY